MEEGKSIDKSIEACEDMISDNEQKIKHIQLLILAVIISSLLSVITYPMFSEYRSEKRFNALKEERTTLQKVFNDNQAFYSEQQKQNILNNIQIVNKSILNYTQPDNKIIIYIMYGVFILFFGILTSFYRFYIKQVSKYEHYLIGFHRIRIAGNNSEAGYEGDVKRSLTQDAFTFENPTMSKRVGKVESPLPGHPTSDISSHIVNKILDTVEFIATPKTK